MKDSASATHRPSPGWLRPVLSLLVGGCVIWYACYLLKNITPYAGGSDSSGYFNHARLLSEGKYSVAPRLVTGQSITASDRLAVVPLGFALRPGGYLVPTYPVGYPLQLIACSIAGRDHAAVLLNLVTALASGWLMYAYGRKLGFNHSLALGGTALLWLCPLFLFSAFQPMSDLSALGWSLAVLYWGLLARERGNYSLLSGAALGIAILVRPTNFLLVIPVLVALGFRPRLWTAVALAALPAVVFFGFYNWKVYGSPWITGYGSISSTFSLEFMRHNLAHFLHWVPLLLSPLVVVALVAPFTAAGRQRGLAALAAWAITLTGFYLFYYHSGETWWYLRFILPAFPALILSTLAVFETLWRAGKSRATAILLSGLFLLGLGWEQREIHTLMLFNLRAQEQSYFDSAQWAKENLPDNSVVFCMQVSGAFFYYTKLALLRWDQIEPAAYAPLLDTIARDNRPVYAVLFAFEAREALEKIGGNWTKLKTIDQVTVWQRQ